MVCHLPGPQCRLKILQGNLLMHRSFQPTSCLDAIWTCEVSAASQLSQWISMRVGHRRGTNTAYKNDRHEAFFHWPQYRWFHLMKVSRNKKMAVLTLQYSDKGGVMTKIMGNHTGDHNIQLFKLNRNVISIWDFLPAPVAIVQIVLVWNSKTRIEILSHNFRATQ